MRKALVVLAAAAALLAAGAQPAGATGECRGLLVCVPIAGPWVVVPVGSRAPQPKVEYQLSCPRGYIVGGTDAEVSDRFVDVGFFGRLGSPVNPGVTTVRAAVFTGSFAGAVPRGPTFRPHVGCLPTSGGGGGPVPYRPSAGFPAAEPTIRRLRTVQLKPSRTQRVVRGCEPGERLVGAAHAIGLYRSTPPSQALTAGVRTQRTVANGRVSVDVTTTGVIRGVRAVIQVAALCSGGR